jgi:hypothetical protein
MDEPLPDPIEERLARVIAAMEADDRFSGILEAHLDQLEAADTEEEMAAVLDRVLRGQKRTD